MAPAASSSGTAAAGRPRAIRTSSSPRATSTFELEGSKLKGRWHLVHMKGRDKGGKENWLLIKADDEYARSDGGAGLLEDEPRSVKTGRTVEDVGRQRGAASGASLAVQASTAKRPRKCPRRLPKHIDAPAPPAELTVKGAKPAALPSFIEPALASLVEKPPTGDRWVHEIKFDGYRLLARHRSRPRQAADPQRA